MPGRIRFAESGDAGAIQAIYAPYCDSTSVSFEIHAPTVKEIAARIARIVPQYPWLVCDLDGQLAGYVYACPHRERAAYRWSVDVTVYVGQEFQRRGIGRALYTSLLEMLRHQGYVNAYAGVTLPNAGSVGVHEAVGFRQVALYPRVGFKFGEWRDVGWWHLVLQPDWNEPPTEPTPIDVLRTAPAVLAAIAEGERMLGN